MVQPVSLLGLLGQVNAFSFLVLCHLLLILLRGALFIALEKELRAEVEQLWCSLQENSCVQVSRMSKSRGKSLCSPQ